MKMLSFNKLFSFLFLGLLLLTPLFSVNESLALIFGGIKSNSVALTSPYIKGIKDLVFIAFAALFVLELGSKYRLKRSFFVFAISLLVFILWALVLSANPIVFAIGVRWILPLFFPVFFLPFVSYPLVCKVAKLLDWLLLFQLLLQLIQLFCAQSWFGVNAFGLSARNPGFFFMPSTAGLFAICVYLAHVLVSQKRSLRITLSVFFSILLTTSAMPIIIFFISYFLVVTRKRLFSVFPLVLPIPLILSSLLLYFSSRGLDVFSQSFGPRIQIFSNLITNSNFVPSDFGLGTATSYLVANALNINLDSVATESFYASFIVNLGLFGFLLFLALCSVLVLVSYLNRNFELFLVVLVVMMSSGTVVLSEVYPANMILGLLITFSLFHRSEHVSIQPSLLL